MQNSATKNADRPDFEMAYYLCTGFGDTNVPNPDVCPPAARVDSDWPHVTLLLTPINGYHVTK